MSVETAAYRATVGLFAPGVTVVTTVSGGVPHGMTANAFASVSLDPLLVLVCVDRRAGLNALLPESGQFAITLLSAAQQGASRWFATSGRPDGAAQFDGYPCRPAPISGSPVLTDGLAYLDCCVAERLDGGDHSIFLGEVLDLGTLDGTAPLLFFAGRYHHLAD